MVGDPILTVSNLSVQFTTDEGVVTAVEDLSFSVEPGQTLGIVGESGSGKSVSTKALMRLLPENAVIGPNSRILYRTKKGETVDIAKLSDPSKPLDQIRGGEISMIFQEPSAAFSPLYTIGNQMIEGIRIHRNMSRKAARQEAIAMLDRVGMTNPELRVDQYAFQLSGGMRQRAMIALALVMRPALLIADEPTTALDVTIQAQILDLLAELQQEFGMAILFISHDLAVISQMSDRVLVMYLGKAMETGPVRTIIRHAKHPYTQGLIKAIPSLDTLDQPLLPIPGDIPSPLERPTGCVFHTRCLESDQTSSAPSPPLRVKPFPPSQSWLALTILPPVTYWMIGKSMIWTRWCWVISEPHNSGCIFAGAINPMTIPTTSRPTTSPPTITTTPIVSVRDLRVHYPIGKGIFFKQTNQMLQAVAGVSFDIMPGQILGTGGRIGVRQNHSGSSPSQSLSHYQWRGLGSSWGCGVECGSSERETG